MRSMTVAVPSHQRRHQLRRLLDSLEAELVRDPRLAAGLDVMVVLDGSTDGSQEMLEELVLPVPLDVRWQPQRGAAAARNVAIDHAPGELLWFIDDDMVIAEGTLSLHRRAHDDPADGFVLIGPCLFPPDWKVVPGVRGWADTMYAAFREAGEMTSAAYFSPANTSAPQELLKQVGGFDESFEIWGGEDMELGVRLMEAAIPVRYDDRAVTWHLQPGGGADQCSKTLQEARCAVRLVTMYPETFEDLYPEASTLHPTTRWLLSHYPRRPLGLVPLAGIAGSVAEILERLLRREPGRSWAFRFAAGLARFAGLVAEDRDGRVRRRLVGVEER